MKWRNLAPDLIRQRLIIEGTTEKIVMPEKIKKFLIDISRVTNMESISGPFAYSAHEMGYGGWIHWKTSGTHFYSYPTTPPLFTIDMYTCKPFSIEKAIDFVKKYFNPIDIVYKEIKI